MIQSPIVARAATRAAMPGHYCVLYATYQRGAEDPIGYTAHRTLKAAIRSLATLIANRKDQRPSRGVFMAYIRTPSGFLLSLTDARKDIAARGSDLSLPSGKASPGKALTFL